MTRNHWLTIALLASLALNLFALSFLAGSWAGRWRGGDGAIATLMERVPYPAPIRRAILAELRADPGPLLDAFRTLRAARAAMFDAQRAAELDRAELEARAEDVRGATDRLQALVQAAIVRALEKATPEDRAAIREPAALGDLGMFGLGED